MATNRDIQDVDTLHCPICFEIYTKPKYLPCLHTFCESCLASYIQTSVSKAEDGKCSFNCPVCRSVNVQHDQGILLEKWVEQFPLNHQILSLMDELSPKTNQTHCGPCQKDGELVPAKHWCKECKDSFCDDCKKFHNKLNYRTEHKVIPVQDVQETGDTSVYKEEPCSFHSGKYIEVFCVDHNLPCCVVCVATKHRGCGSVKSLEEIGEAYKENGDVKKFLKMLQCAQDEVETVNKRRRRKFEELGKQKHTIIADFDKEIDNLRKKLDHLQNSFHQEMEQVHKNNCKNLELNQEYIETFKNELIRAYTHLSNILRNGPKWYLALSVYKTVKTLSDAQVIYQENIKQSVCVGYSTELTEKLKKVNDSIVKKVHIEQVMPEDTVEIHSRIHYFDPSNWPSIVPRLHVSFKDIEAKNFNTFTIPSRKGCIRGGTYIDDERLVLCNYTTKTLHMFDNQGGHMTDFTMDKQPWDAAFMRYRNGSYLLVSLLPIGLNVYTIIGSSKFVLTKTVKTEERICGLDTMGESIIAAGRQYIYVMQFDGNITKKIRRRDVNYVPSIAVYERQNQFFYNDEEKTLMCRSLNGAEVYCYQNDCLKNSAGIGVDINGNVYVCCVNDCKIYQISNNGKDGRIFMTNLGKITQPWAIGFDPKGIKLFLTDYNESDSVEIYQMQ